jgi:hypothetical protein
MFFFLYLFTFWTIVLCIFHEYTYKYFNLLYLTFIVFIAGLYISYVNPKYYIYEVNNETIVFDGFSKFYVIDIFCHTLPFLYIYYVYGTYYTSKSLLDFPLTILLILLFLIILNAKKVYGLTQQEVILLYIGITVLYHFL